MSDLDAVVSDLGSRVAALEAQAARGEIEDFSVRNRTSVTASSPRGDVWALVADLRDLCQGHTLNWPSITVAQIRAVLEKYEV